MLRTTTICFMTLALGASCTTSDDTTSDSPPVDGFELVQRTGDTVEARAVGAGASLHLLAVAVEPGVVDVTFDFGDPVLAFRIDYNEGIGDFTPSGTALDAAQKNAAAAMLAGLEATLPGDDAADERTQVDEAAYRQTNLLQIIPAGEQLGSYQFKSERGWRHLSCSCKSQYIGGGYYRTCGRGCNCGGGNGCKGRCGGGCGGWGSVAYTRDCGRHDWGVGSWGAASDDYAFASNNCSGGC